MPHVSVAAAWRQAWTGRSFRWQCAFTLAALVSVLGLLARYLEHNESRPGVVLPDPLLSLFPPHDLTWLTFSLVYVALVTAIVFLLRHPATLLVALQAYALLVVFRIVAMSLVPLEPPPSMIVLNDPLVETFGTGRVLTKDLFFSGHTSTLFLLFLVMPPGRLRTVFLACSVLVACCVLIQHVHYAIDVFAAPFAAFAAVRIVQALHADADARAAVRARDRLS